MRQRLLCLQGALLPEALRPLLRRKAARQKVPAARIYANAVPALSALNIAHTVTILTRVTIETSGAADGFTSAST